jgi:hypothetical protein
MKEILLNKIRLSWYFAFFLVAYVAICISVNTRNFSSGALALFSVNSFLYGFYIAPILGQQKARIDELHKISRTEANAIFSMVIKIKSLNPELRNSLQDMFVKYLRSCTKEQKPAEGEKQYEELITYCLNYQGKDKPAIDKLLESLVANQQNRTNLSMQLRNKVYSNEWVIMLFLFAVTLTFIVLLNTGPELMFRVLSALLCTGLTMLVVILVKLSTLTHKKARQIWDPYKKLLSSHFYRID